MADSISVAVWSAVASALATGAITELLRRRSKLVWHLGHASSFPIRHKDNTTTIIHTHTVVVQNNGRDKASNVRLGHAVLPEDFNIFPAVPHRVEVLGDGSKDIVVDALVPGQMITVSYLYFPPLVWNQINTSCRSDEGFAQTVTMLSQRQYSRSFNILAALLFIIGCATSVAWLTRAAFWMYRYFRT